jgi:hypothetical protein
MPATHPIMTFRCARCRVTADPYVSPAADVQQSTVRIGMAFKNDYDNPRNSTVLCGCSLDEMGERTEMTKISERS